MTPDVDIPKPHLHRMAEAELPCYRIHEPLRSRVTHSTTAGKVTRFNAMGKRRLGSTGDFSGPSSRTVASLEGMNTMPTPRSSVPSALGAALVLAACSGGSGPATTPAPTNASEAEWLSLAGAARVSVSGITLLGDPWDLQSSTDLSLGISELIVTGLLRRADVNLVERRRFAVAAEAERLGQARPAGAPAAGVSAGAEFMLSGSWSSLGLDSAYLDLSLTDAQSGSVVTSWRTATADDADPTALTRTIIGSLLTALDDMGRRPEWRDPDGDTAPASYRGTSISLAAVDAFLRGLSAEERWNWEGARRGYLAALAEGGSEFVEAAAALARTGRLRNGGTLGASE